MCPVLMLPDSRHPRKGRAALVSGCYGLRSSFSISLEIAKRLPLKGDAGTEKERSLERAHQEGSFEPLGTSGQTVLETYRLLLVFIAHVFSFTGGILRRTLRERAQGFLLVYHFFRTGITRSSAPTGPMTESSFIVFFESDERPPVRGGRTRRERPERVRHDMPRRLLCPRLVHRLLRSRMNAFSSSKELLNEETAGNQPGNVPVDYPLLSPVIGPYGADDRVIPVLKKR